MSLQKYMYDKISTAQLFCWDLYFKPAFLPYCFSLGLTSLQWLSDGTIRYTLSNICNSFSLSEYTPCHTHVQIGSHNSSLPVWEKRCFTGPALPLALHSTYFNVLWWSLYMEKKGHSATVGCPVLFSLKWLKLVAILWFDSYNFRYCFGFLYPTQRDHMEKESSSRLDDQWPLVSKASGLVISR